MNKYRKHVSRLRACTMPDLQLKYEFALQSRRPTDNIAPYFKANRWPVKAWPKGSLPHQGPHDCFTVAAVNPQHMRYSESGRRWWSKFCSKISPEWTNYFLMSELQSNSGHVLPSSLLSAVPITFFLHTTWHEDDLVPKGFFIRCALNPSHAATRCCRWWNGQIRKWRCPWACAASCKRNMQNHEWGQGQIKLLKWLWMKSHQLIEHDCFTTKWGLYTINNWDVIGFPRNQAWQWSIALHHVRWGNHLRMDFLWGHSID